MVRLSQKLIIVQRRCVCASLLFPELLAVGCKPVMGLSLLYRTERDSDTSEQLVIECYNSSSV